MPIHFYSRIAAFGAFSNFEPSPIFMDGLIWPTVEHYFQAQKFEDAAYRETIRAAKTPQIAKTLGRTRKLPLRADWETVKDGVMLDAVRAKFEAHAALRELLLSTGGEDLIEAAPTDSYWGAGRNGAGQNKLGKILMAVREELRAAGAD